MRGLMMDRPLSVPSILDYAADRYGDTEMVSCAADAPVHRTTYAALRARVRQLAGALESRLGVRPGDRIATLAWNDHRHFELYYGIAGIGAICHTVSVFESQTKRLPSLSKSRKFTREKPVAYTSRKAPLASNRHTSPPPRKGSDQATKISPQPLVSMPKSSTPAGKTGASIRSMVRE